jgi:decaprenylphospho-beta-D-erythro-pentofuranosid-2-ulose 2-reductase
MIDAVGRVESLFVLGGTSDIGVATSRRLIRDGCSRVVLAGRDTTRLKELSDSLLSDGARSVEPLEFDALKFDVHEQVVEEGFERLGEVDVVLMCFGVLGDQGRAETDAGHTREIIETNFTAAASLGICTAQRLLTQGHGCIVVISSVAGERARRSNFVYGSSKAGLDAFFQGMAASLEGTGVRSLIVRPGFVKTKMTQSLKTPPLSSTPEDVAAAIVSALATRKEIVWVPPVMRPVMSVLRHLPTPLFRKIPI